MSKASRWLIWIGKEREGKCPSWSLKITTTVRMNFKEWRLVILMYKCNVYIL
jgi:hypothetical protein